MLQLLATSLPFIARPFGGSPAFCLPDTGPVSLTLAGLQTSRNANYNYSTHISQYLRRDRDLQAERVDYEQFDLNNALGGGGTNLINYKTNEQWSITKDAAGKPVCTKGPPPGPQPNGNNCIVPSAAPVRRGTQGPVEVTWFEGPYYNGQNMTIAAAGEEALAENLLH